MNNTLRTDIEYRQRLVEDYASFSQSRGGLGKVLGGVAGLVVILSGTLLGGGLITGVLTIGVVVLWLVGKEVARARLYRRLGEVQEVWTADKRHTHLMLTGFVGIVSMVIIIAIALNGDVDTPERWVYLAFVILMPFITWRFLRTPLEFIVGVFLLAACAVHGSGGAYSLIPSDTEASTLGVVAATWSPFISAFVLIGLGWQEHQRFQKLAAQLQIKGNTNDGE